MDGGMGGLCMGGQISENEWMRDRQVDDEIDHGQMDWWMDGWTVSGWMIDGWIIDGLMDR